MSRIAAASWILVLLCAAPPAAASDADLSVRVIGFSADGATVVLRHSMDIHMTEDLAEDEITVELFDLSRGETVRTYPIFQAGTDTEADTEADRKRRWNECATELQAQGYTIDPDYAMTERIPALDVALVPRRVQPDPELTEYQIDLYVQKPGGEPVLIQEAVFAHSGSVMNPTSLAGFFLDPTGTYLFAAIARGGSLGPVIRVADIAAKLGAPAAPPPAKQP